MYDYFCDVSLDYLVGISSELVKDKKMINRLEDIKKLPEKEREKIFDYIDLIIRDLKIKKAHAAFYFIKYGYLLLSASCFLWISLYIR